MDFTIELGKAFNISPFDILQQDKDEVIMLINYFIEKGDETEIESNHETPQHNNGGRIRVNDKTATGGWF